VLGTSKPCKYTIVRDEIGFKVIREIPYLRNFPNNLEPNFFPYNCVFARLGCA
jgi:hypothetical protein